MKLFTKTLIAAGLLATCTGWADICTKTIPGDLGTPRIMRAVALAQDKVWPGQDIFPDPNWQLAIGFGVLTAAQGEALENEAFADFFAKYGLDFSDSNPTVEIDLITHDRKLPGIATFKATIQGAHKDFFLILDSEATNRGRDWYVIIPAVTIEFTSTGMIPGGTYAGHNYYEGYRYLKGFIHLLKNNANPDLPPNSEVFRLVSPQLSPRSTTSWARHQWTYILDLLDASGNPGFYIDSSSVLFTPGIVDPPVLKSHPVLLWKCFP